MTRFDSFAEDCFSIREQAPLVLNITNYVAMDLIANSLLAIGASPLMSSEPLEIAELVALSRAVVINIGCIESGQLEAMKIAASTAHALGRPWILDPAGVGASKFRKESTMNLIHSFHPDIIRGNASEIMTLAGMNVLSKGVDSVCASGDAVEAAKSLALELGLVVSISGEVDYITDGTDVNTVANGTGLMPYVTAMGCTASALTGAFAAVDGNMLSAASNAMALMGVAGEAAAAGRCGAGSAGAFFKNACSPGALPIAGEAAAAGSLGTGTLRLRFVDFLSTFNPEDVQKQIRTL